MHYKLKKEVLEEIGCFKCLLGAMNGKHFKVECEILKRLVQGREATGELSSALATTSQWLLCMFSLQEFTHIHTQCITAISLATCHNLFSSSRW